MVDSPLILVSNPGSYSRKYSIYIGNKFLGQLNFETNKKQIQCTIIKNQEKHTFEVKVNNLDSVLGLIIPLFEKYKVIASKNDIQLIGIRIMAPSSYFLRDRVVNADVIEHLKTIANRVPNQNKETLKELKLIKLAFPRVKVVAVSDSKFYARKPDHAWNYGINLRDADRLNLKKFGYHGLSAQSIVDKLKAEYKLPQKLIVCHLGNVISIHAISNGKGMDCSMGFSANEGPIMATKSGSVDQAAVNSIKSQLGLKQSKIEEYLTNKSGLVGLSGISGDIRELLAVEKANHNADLAIKTYIYSIQKNIGQMAAVLNGCDALVFTGTVGARSSEIRRRIIDNLDYLRLIIDHKVNNSIFRENEHVTSIHQAKHSKPIYIIKSDEAGQIAKITLLNR